jgi:hypothetical protein
MRDGDFGDRSRKMVVVETQKNFQTLTFGEPEKLEVKIKMVTRLFIVMRRLYSRPEPSIKAECSRQCCRG